MSEGRINNSSYAGRPSVCWNCGALVGAGEPKCAVCDAAVSKGAPATHSPNPSARHADPDTMRFVRTIISRPATFTFIILIANVFVFILMTMAGGSDTDPVLRAYGAKYNSLINHGEWWRLVTPVFMHIGVIHILVNMYSLFVLGPYVEKLYGSAKFVFFWVLTGVGGVAASYFASMYQMHEGFLGRFLFRGGDGPSAGASGALFGLVGVLFVFGIKFRHELPEEFKRAFGTGMLPTILINLFIGYTIPFIDNAAHLGGFLAGVVLALFVHYKRPGEKAGVAIAWHVLQAAALALVVVSFAMVWRHFSGPAPALQRVTTSALIPGGKANEFISFAKTVGEGESAFVQAFNNNDAGRIDAALQALEKVPKLDAQATALVDEEKELLVRVRGYATGSPPRTRAQREQKVKLLKDFTSWQESFNKWVNANSEAYGVEVKEKQSATPATPASSPSQASPAPSPADER